MGRPGGERVARRLRCRAAKYPKGSRTRPWGLAETGASGPTGNRYGDAAGHSCLAVSGPHTTVVTLETAATDRQANMRTFAETALKTLLQSLDAAAKA